MSKHKGDMSDAKSRPDISSKAARATSTRAHWYRIPEPIRRVFDQFPLVTYKENPLPQKANRATDKHTLHIFPNPYDATGANLSCNPACLKWQAYLKFNDIDFSAVASNNHASPSGSLPFLTPAASAKEPPLSPLTKGKISKWVSQQTMQEEEALDVKQEAYLSLIDLSIRNAWLYYLYIDRDNSAAVAHHLYVSTSSSNRFVQMTITYQLREAAKYELLKSMQVIDSEDIYAAAEKAFRALSNLLGGEKHFSKEDRPGLFDASLFAYTQLILDESMPWSNKSLQNILREYSALTDHRSRLLELCLKS